MKSSQKVYLALFSQEIYQIIFHKIGTFVTWINSLDCFSSVTRRKYLAEICYYLSDEAAEPHSWSRSDDESHVQVQTGRGE